MRAIVVTCFNKANYIEAAIKSALRCSSNVIVVDDCSTDKSWDIISKFEDVTKLRKPKNVGVTIATISGIEAAREQGFEYVVLLDGDDVIAPDALEHYAQVMSKYSVSAVYSKCSRGAVDQRVNAVPVGDEFDVEVLDRPMDYYLQRFPATTAVCAKCDDMLRDLVPTARIQDHQIAFSIHRNAGQVAISSAPTHLISEAVEGNSLALDTPEKAVSAVLTYGGHWELVKDHPLAYRMRNRAFSQLLRLVNSDRLPFRYRVSLLRYTGIHQIVSQKRKHRELLRAIQKLNVATS